MRAGDFCYFILEFAKIFKFLPNSQTRREKEVNWQSQRHRTLMFTFLHYIALFAHQDWPVNNLSATETSPTCDSVVHFLDNQSAWLEILEEGKIVWDLKGKTVCCFVIQHTEQPSSTSSTECEGCWLLHNQQLQHGSVSTDFDSWLVTLRHCWQSFSLMGLNNWAFHVWRVYKINKVIRCCDWFYGISLVSDMTIDIKLFYKPEKYSFFTSMNTCCNSATSHCNSRTQHHQSELDSSSRGSFNYPQEMETILLKILCDLASHLTVFSKTELWLHLNISFLPPSSPVRRWFFCWETESSIIIRVGRRRRGGQC